MCNFEPREPWEPTPRIRWPGGNALHFYYGGEAEEI